MRIIPKAWISGKLKTDWAPFRRFASAVSPVVAPVLAVVVLSSVMITIITCDRERHYAERERQRASLEELSEWTKTSNQSQSQLDANDQFLQDEMRALRADVDIAIEEIRYYRDQMKVIVKTCPGRVHAPNLPWKPSHVSEDRGER